MVDKKFFDSSFPLMERFRDDAPGTYRHCQGVSSICEAIGLDIGIDVDIIKLAAMYHDVGKIQNPAYFSENQSRELNPHDDIDPFTSYNIITRHVGDSVILLLQYNFPLEVVQIISQHHGNTILKPFYTKAKGTAKKKDVEGADFRYKCCKPQTTEAAILMIVDSIEAATRAEFQKENSSDTPKVVSNVIENITKRLVDDGQLNELKIGILKVAQRVAQKELENIHHKRVSYDEGDEKTIGEIKKKNGEPIDEDDF